MPTASANPGPSPSLMLDYVASQTEVTDTKFPADGQSTVCLKKTSPTFLAVTRECTVGFS